ncbi:MAG: trimeric intracellular cation channel family protein [Gemmatimonadales bacterium]|nr:MAG: trimeric intracellular cation channel family protein [Gemmatimonadales bacterium]
MAGAPGESPRSVSGAGWCPPPIAGGARSLTTELSALLLVDLLGVGVFAISGALAALRKEMDLLGVLVIAAVTALGGGTVRDLLLDRHPVVWVTEPGYLYMALAAAIATVIYTRFREAPQSSLAIADALGLGFFVIAGARLTVEMGYTGVIVVLMGTTTGVVGGVIRDILSAQVPLILRKGELYATTAIAGATAYLVLLGLGVIEGLSAAIGMVTVVGLRFAAIRWGIGLPVIPLRRG